MRLLRRLAALATVLALTWLLAPSAMAGGPTSVLLTSPASSETASLYYSDEDYAELSNLLVTSPEREQGQRPPGLHMEVGTRQINVTWLVHDVQPWRLDQVYLSKRPEVVWIHTSTDMETQQGTWHKAGHPKDLFLLVKKLGLLGRTSSEGGGAQPPPAWEQGEDQSQNPGEAGAPEEQSAAPPATDPAAATATATATDGSTDWWWAIPGLAAGAVLALVLRPLASRLPRPPFGRGGGTPETGPRQQLLDT
ncbi:hypothetical protein OG883_02915 [Streptomyces sp. NBC_01142]|uniref:hypothetical protein n=1 Tax=Streptomyces sp. NBC_01142 TaxID=2975865 RepID=UPI00225B0288|nr:hypothetical protein [Streptomyces sp. NBC_01142]MCX4818870.1 hypothetical protein [Streptomyces sp. NBC_01142]